MLTHPTLDLLHQLGLNGMAKAFGEIEASSEATTLTHPEWLALLLDREASYRSDRRLHARLRYAKLCYSACKIGSDAILVQSDFRPERQSAELEANRSWPAHTSAV